MVSCVDQRQIENQLNKKRRGSSRRDGHSLQKNKKNKGEMNINACDYETYVQLAIWLYD